jgi:uncharacterized protein YkwD
MGPTSTDNPFVPRRPPRASNGPGDTPASADHPLRHGLAAAGVFVAAMVVAIGVPAVVAGETSVEDRPGGPVDVHVDNVDVAASQSDLSPAQAGPVAAGGPVTSLRTYPVTAPGRYGPTEPDEHPGSRPDQVTAPADRFGVQAAHTNGLAQGDRTEALLPFDRLPTGPAIATPPSPTPAPAVASAGPEASASPVAPSSPPSSSPAPVPVPAPAAPAPTPAPAPVTPPVRSGRSAAQVVATLVALVNGERAAAGLAPLAVDGGLAAAARAQAERMAAAGTVSHQDLAAVAGLGWSAVGENAAHGDDPTGLHQAFMGSGGHRANVLGATFTHLGIGVVVADDGSIWVAEVFAG